MGLCSFPESHVIQRFFFMHPHSLPGSCLHYAVPCLFCFCFNMMEMYVYFSFFLLLLLLEYLDVWIRNAGVGDMTYEGMIEVS